MRVGPDSVGRRQSGRGVTGYSYIRGPHIFSEQGHTGAPLGVNPALPTAVTQPFFLSSHPLPLLKGVRGYNLESKMLVGEF